MRETASKSALLLSPCTRWAHPVSKWYEERPEDAEAREEGKEIHSAIHHHILGIPYSAPESVRNKVQVATTFFDDVLRPRCKWVKPEVALGKDITSGKTVLIENMSDRQYPQDDTTFYGTADIVAELHSGALLIADWKSRGGDGAEEQLKSLQCMYAGEFPQRRIATLYIGDESVYAPEREVPTAELEQHWSDIVSAITGAREARPRLPVLGPHCAAMYCPHLAKCPAHVTELDSPADSSDATHLSEVPEDSKHAGMMAVKLKALKRIQQYYEGHLKDWIKEGNRASAGGYEYKQTGRGFMLVKDT